VLLVLFSGCGGGKKPKYTEEELANIPFARRTDLPKASGGFVLAVGDDTITADEIVLPLMEDFRPFAQRNSFEQFKAKARIDIERVLITIVSDMLLYQQAKENTSVDDEALEKAAEREVRKFVVGFGGDYARAEEALQQRGMDWQSFKEYQKRLILTQSYMASQLSDNRPITYSELVDAYNEMKDEYFSIEVMLKFWLIDIEPAELEVVDPNQSRLERARELVDELVGRIRAGEDFNKLAEKRSGVSFIDHSKGVRPESLEKPYDILVAEAKKIKPGQIAGPIEAGEHIFIMKLEDKQTKGYNSLEEVQREVKAKILSDRWRKAVGELTAKLVQQAALSNMDEFIDFCLERIYRLSNQKISE
jgi:hypothetical protein